MLTLKVHTTGHTLSDSELIGLIRDGDAAAFNELHRRHFQALCRAAWNVLKDKDACMDVIQDVFTWFWTHREQHAMSSPKGYLLMAVKYQVANTIRSGKVKANFFDRAAKQQLSYSLNAESTEFKELKAFIQKIAATLPERCREVYELSRDEQLNNREIAERMGISEKTVEAQLTKALKVMRTQLSHLSSWHFFL